MKSHPVALGAAAVFDTRDGDHSGIARQRLVSKRRVRRVIVVIVAHSAMALRVRPTQRPFVYPQLAGPSSVLADILRGRSVLLRLTQTKLFRELAHTHSFRCHRLQRWRWLGWMMNDRILSGPRYAQRKCARSSVITLDRTLE